MDKNAHIIFCCNRFSFDDIYKLQQRLLMRNDQSNKYFCFITIHHLGFRSLVPIWIAPLNENIRRFGSNNFWGFMS